MTSEADWGNPRILLSDSEYVGANGGLCPYCRSSNIEAGPLQADGPVVWSRVDCRACGEAWTDRFELSGWEPIPKLEDRP